MDRYSLPVVVHETESTINCRESCLVDVPLDYSDLFIGVRHVYFRAKGGSSNVVLYLILVWKGGDVLDCVVISLSKFYYGS